MPERRYLCAKVATSAAKLKILGACFNDSRPLQATDRSQKGASRAVVFPADTLSSHTRKDYEDLAKRIAVRTVRALDTVWRSIGNGILT